MFLVDSRALILAAIAGLCGSGLAHAQTASQVTPAATRPADSSAQTLVFSGEPGLGAPAGADQLSVSLAGVEISGGKPELAEAEAALKAALSGKRVSLAEIFSRARDLEAAYNQAGFILVRVVVPAQRLNDGGTLQLTVVDGFLERIDAANVPDAVKARIVNMLMPLLRRPGVTLDEIERRLLIAGDTPGVSMTSALATGSEPGGAVLVVNAKLDVIVPFLGFDNTLPESLGTWVVHTGVDFNSLLNQGETIYFRASAHPEANDAQAMFGTFDDDPRYRTLTSGMLIPIGLDGLTFNVEGVVTQTTPAPIGLLQTSSLFEKITARWVYPFVRSRQTNITGKFTFDAQNEYQNVITGIGDLPVFEDRLRIARFTVETSVANAGTLTTSTTLSLGLPGLGARTLAEATPVPLSRQGADATFAKLEAKLGYSQTLAPNFAFSLTGRAQTSFGQPLLQSEQFSIANTSELSTFDSGAITGDSGWVVRFEPSFPFTIQTDAANTVVSPYVFGAAGAVYLHQPTVLEAPMTQAASAGLGVRLVTVAGETQSSLSVEYGWAFREPGPDGTRLTVVGTSTF